MCVIASNDIIQASIDYHQLGRNLPVRAQERFASYVLETGFWEAFDRKGYKVFVRYDEVNTISNVVFDGDYPSFSSFIFFSTEFLE